MSDCECLKSISNNEKNCLLFKKGDKNDLENKIENIIKNGYNIELINNGYKFIIDERNWILQGNKLNNFLKK